ncbi:hypothetical protein ACFSVK_14595 [Azorhizophilus paspali]|uniref:hypothetical protein n=1 Tax=Azorhizophilus paspali TaxID=69963 RepID=UPI0036336138
MSSETIRDTLGPQALPWFAMAFLVLVGVACVEGWCAACCAPAPTTGGPAPPRSPTR